MAEFFKVFLFRPEHIFQEVFEYDRRKVTDPAVIEVAAPPIGSESRKGRFLIFHLSLTPCRMGHVERIEMDVVGDVEHVGVALDMHELVFALPQRSGTCVPFIKIFRVSHVELLHEKRDTVLYRR